MTEITNIISAFSADQVVRLSGLTIRQLAYWDQLGFFQPQYASVDRQSPHSRIYSFKDVVGLRTLSILRKDYNCSLRQLQEVAKELAAHSKTPWADLTLYVLNGEVNFGDPDTGRTRGVINKQYALLPMSSVVELVTREAEQLRQRNPSQIGRIEKHRNVSHQAPVISGTRIRVATVLRFIEAGYSTADILKEYPSLTKADVEAVKRHGKAGLAA